MQGIYRETFQWRKYYLTTSTLPPFSPFEPKTLPTTPATKQGKGKGKGKSKSKAIQQKTTLLPDSTPTNQPRRNAKSPEPNPNQNPLLPSSIIHHKKSHQNNANHPHQTLATRFPQPTPLRLRRSFLSLIEDFGRVSIATTRTRTTTTTTTIRTARATRATTTGRENLM